jgi:hypothetical protein
MVLLLPGYGLVPFQSSLVKVYYRYCLLTAHRNDISFCRRDIHPNPNPARTIGRVNVELWSW